MERMESKKVSDKNVTKMLGFASLLCCMLYIGRIYYSSSFYFGFLIWNLFLAWIPFYLSGKLIKMDDDNRSKITIGCLFFAWVLFFPNSPYILTDLFHLKEKQNIPLWYDLILIISFAWNGLMIGFVSLLEMQVFLNRKYSIQKSWIVIISMLILSGFGIYLGRYERWNSWDIVTNPIDLMIDIFKKLSNPFSHPRTVGVTIVFSSFLLISYLTLFTLIKSKSHEQ
jgi:uncharacterized membrane protein